MATNGQFVIHIDFQTVNITAPVMLTVFPGQVHHLVSASKAKGWMMSVDSALVSKGLQAVMEQHFRQPLLLDKKSGLYHHAITLMSQVAALQSGEMSQYRVKASHLLLDALLQLLAGEVITLTSSDKTKPNRGTMLGQAFVQLVSKHYKDWKQPAQYAAALNISSAHLYDTIKRHTGESPSVYIQQYSILEAKRLLCFTDATVKEISYGLGYDEPVYFGKLFKKITGVTPLQFRRQCRD